MLSISLSGPARAVAAVTQALAALNPYPPTAWTLRESPGRCEIRDGDRAVVAFTWERAVAAMLAPPAPLCSVVVRGPGRWR